MAYCTVADVRFIIDTTLTDAEISGIIDMSDAEIDRRIGAQDTSDKLVKKLSILLTAHTIKTRQPQSQAIGEYREDAGDVVDVWEREIERIFRLYKTSIVKASEYEHIDEAKRHPEA
ncbi:MAG: hypothetical protein ACTSPV_13965 [Candidatus Hodarchaeales archaeon]